MVRPYSGVGKLGLVKQSSDIFWHYDNILTQQLVVSKILFMLVKTEWAFEAAIIPFLSITSFTNPTVSAAKNFSIFISLLFNKICREINIWLSNCWKQNTFRAKIFKPSAKSFAMGIIFLLWCPHESLLFLPSLIKVFSIIFHVFNFNGLNVLSGRKLLTCCAGTGRISQSISNCLFNSIRSSCNMVTRMDHANNACTMARSNFTRFCP